MHKFIIFAHPRSGSTNLSVILGDNNIVNIAGEPFHENYSGINPNESNYIDFVYDEESLDVQLNLLFNKYDGLKVLDYQLPPKLNRHLLQRPDIKIIFLQRKNRLKSLISDLIAKQTNIWYKRIDENIDKFEYPVIEKLDVVKIKNRLQTIHQHINDYDQVLNKRTVDSVYKLTYEELYSRNIDSNVAKVREIFDFLELPCSNIDKIAEFLNPSTGKLNSEETYRLIPNIQEIEEQFGNDETGWLFK